MAMTNSKYFLLKISTGCTAVLFWGATFAAVTPPPLPLGSSVVKVEAGLNEVERKRQERAHRHKLQVKKDTTRDDTQDAPLDTQPQSKTKKLMKVTP